MHGCYLTSHKKCCVSEHLNSALSRIISGIWALCQTGRATDNNSINSGSLVVLEDQRSADQRRQFLLKKPDAGVGMKMLPSHHRWVMVRELCCSCSVGWRRLSYPIWARAWVTPAHVRSARLAFALSAASSKAVC